MHVVWNLNLVILSVLIAMYGSFAALTHAERMRITTGRPAFIWMVAGGVTLGLSIWSMHFIGMLAFHLPVSISYDLFLTIISIIPAIAAALLGFYLLREPKMNFKKIILGGITMGAGVSVMHYTGMTALKMQPEISYNPLIFIISLLIAVIAAIGALLIVYGGEKSRFSLLPRHIIGALIMGTAIAGMHYTGMAAANFAPGSVCLAGGNRVEPTFLAMFIAAIVFFVVTTGLIASIFDTRMMQDNAKALELLRKQAKELEIDRDILEKINQGKSLDLVLNELVKQVEALHPEIACVILLLDADKKHLTHLAAPSMPVEYKLEVDFLGVGESISPCTAAAYTGKQIIVEEVIHNPDWAAYQSIAQRYNIRSCWAQPIKNYEESVLGTFAVYHRNPTTPSNDDLARIERYAHLTQLVLQREEHENKLIHVAFHDRLTQLPNRLLLLEKLKQALDSSERKGTHGAVIYIDLDNFKTLNDIRGHSVGDELLKQVAGRLVSEMRKSDTVARLGGDEFVVMLADLDNEQNKAIMQVEQVAEKILYNLRRTFLLHGQQHHLTASIGVSMFQGNSETESTILKHADTAMYQSKHEGRNGLHFFDPEMQQEIDKRLSLQSDLREGIAKNQLYLCYQLQVNDENKTIGAEALVRWRHPVRGQVIPSHFIPLAEETGMILNIGHFVMATACKQLKLWESAPKTEHLILSVNVSVYQLIQPDFVQQVTTLLKETGASPERLKIELTESMVMKDVDLIIEKMQQLRSIGVRFSMDDFGTGYSSLSSLKNLPLTQLKIDKCFVDDITTNASDAAIVKTIIAMGNILGLNVIAEGVETQDQMKLLKEYNCPMFQGYLISKPLPIDEFYHLIEDWPR